MPRRASLRRGAGASSLSPVRRGEGGGEGRIGGRPMAFLSQTNAVEQAAVRVERPDGTQLPYHGHDDASRGAALLSAAAAAAGGDTIRLGPGVFALGAGALDLPHGVSLRGAGPGVSTITSTVTGRAI